MALVLDFVLEEVIVRGRLEGILFDLRRAQALRQGRPGENGFDERVQIRDIGCISTLGQELGDCPEIVKGIVQDGGA